MRLRRPTVDRLRVFDVVLALAFVAIAQASVWTTWEDAESPYDGPLALDALLALGFTLPLAWRRRHPLPVLLTMATSIVVQVLLVEPSAPFFGGFVPVLIATYSVAAYEPGRRALLGAGVAQAAVLIVTMRVSELRDLGDILFDLLTVAAAWIIGRGVHRRAARTDELSEHLELLERTREQHTREAVDRERARIARELHDVVAHSVSVMGVQAGAAEQVLALDAERAREPLRAIQAGAREAIAELRLLLGVLRTGDDGPALAPQPGLDELGALVEQMRRAGLPVRLTLEGSPERLSAGVELSAYRIVQEALTNALKHADAADVRVTVRHEARALELEIVDDGHGRSNGAGRGDGSPGHGLIGMRERVALHGGRITTGHRPEGGYAVRAHLPLDRRGA